MCKFFLILTVLKECIWQNRPNWQPNNLHGNIGNSCSAPATKLFDDTVEFNFIFRYTSGKRSVSFIGNLWDIIIMTWVFKGHAKSRDNDEWDRVPMYVHAAKQCKWIKKILMVEDVLIGFWSLKMSREVRPGTFIHTLALLNAHAWYWYAFSICESETSYSRPSLAWWLGAQIVQKSYH